MQKTPKSMPEKNNIQPETNSEIRPEKTSRMPGKILKKVGEKNIFCPEKKRKKYQKIVSWALLILSGKKNTDKHDRRRG